MVYDQDPSTTDDDVERSGNASLYDRRTAALRGFPRVPKRRLGMLLICVGALFIIAYLFYPDDDSSDEVEETVPGQLDEHAEMDLKDPDGNMVGPVKKGLGLNWGSRRRAVPSVPSPTARENPTVPGAANMTRGERLCAGGTTILYHQTDPETCMLILQTGFDMSLAKPGNLGPGVYFADDAATTNYKTRHTGCIIMALVRLGNVLSLGDNWLQDAGRLQQTCDPLLGYKLAMPGGQSYDSVTTIKHGRERSIFFTDQILDMVAYTTDNHNWVGGRQKLNVPQTCSPADFKSFFAPPCRAPKPTKYACNSGFKDVACIPDGRGNMGGTPVACVGQATLTIDAKHPDECSAKCKAQQGCEAFQISAGRRSKKCNLYDSIPDVVRPSGGETVCQRKIRMFDER